jgi:hypothetical protein
MLPPPILLVAEVPGLPTEVFPFLPMVPVPGLPVMAVPVFPVPAFPVPAFPVPAFPEVVPGVVFPDLTPVVDE